MGREDFISDNLYHMRDRLRQNYEQKQLEKSSVQSAAGPSDKDASAKVPETSSLPENRETPAAPQTNRAEPVLPAVETPRDPSPAATGDDAASDRRGIDELEAMMLRDLAQVRVEIEKSRQTGEVMREFAKALEEMLDELRGAGSDRRGAARVLNGVRRRYFQEYGRFEALHPRVSPVTNTVSRSEVATDSGRFGYWLIFAAVIISSLIISMVLVLLFG